MGSRLKLVFAVFLLLQLLDLSRGLNAFKSPGIEFTVGVRNSDLPEQGTNPNVGTWCVASSTASSSDLQNALNWACGHGGADCSPIQPGHEYYEPNTVVSHASFAFNNYYQKNGATAEACNFGGTGNVVQTDPSYGNCTYR